MSDVIEPTLAVPAVESATPAVQVVPVSASGSRRHILLNVANVAGLGLASRIVGIGYDAYVRRSLGPDVVGMMAWNGAVLAYLWIASNPGVLTVARRAAAKEPTRTAEIFLSSAAVQLGPMLLVLVGCAACQALHLRTGTAGWLLVLQAAAGLFAAVQIRWAFEAIDRYVIVNLLGFGSVLLTFAFAAVAVHAPSDAIRLAACQVVVGAALAAATFAIAVRDGMISMSEIRSAGARAFRGLGAHYREALPLTIAGLSVTLYTSGVALVLGPFHGEAAVGLYTTAYGLTQVGLIAALTLGTVYFAPLARDAPDADGNASPVATAVAFDYFRAVVLTTAPVGLLGWAVGRHALALVYGAAYAPAGPYFEWLCLLLVLIGAAYGLAGPLLPWGRSRVYLRITIVGAVTNVIFTFLLVPRYGVGGAVATMIATEGAVVFASSIVRARLVPMGCGRLLKAAPLMVAIAAGARVAALRWPDLWLAPLIIAASGMAAVMAKFNPGLVSRVLRRKRA